MPRVVRAFLVLRRHECLEIFVKGGILNTIQLGSQYGCLAAQRENSSRDKPRTM